MRLTGVLQVLSGREFLEQLLLGLRPEFRNIGQFLAIDDHQQIIVREIAPDRILDPVAARVASEQNDLEQPAAPQLRHRAAGDREGEALANAVDDKGKLVPLALGQIIKTAFHPLQLASIAPKKQGENLHSPVGAGNVARAALSRSSSSVFRAFKSVRPVGDLTPARQEPKTEPTVCIGSSAADAVTDEPPHRRPAASAGTRHDCSRCRRRWSQSRPTATPGAR